MEEAQVMRRELTQEQERLCDRARQVDERMRLMDGMVELACEHRKLQEECESLQQQLAEEKRQRAELEMKLAEMSKLSAGVAKKTSQDDFEKALRIFLNISRRKTVTKREAAKTVIAEMLTSAKLDIPDDIRDMLDHLDDDQSDPKVVNVQGNYNDSHNPGTVNQK